MIVCPKCIICHYFQLEICKSPKVENHLPLAVKIVKSSNCYGVRFVPFRLFAFSRRKDASRKDEKTKKTPCEKKREKTKKTPCEKTKRQNNAMRKEETRNAKRRNFSAKREKTLCEKTPFGTLFLSSFRVASFPLFAWRFFVLSSLLMTSCRLFAAKRRYAKRRNYATRKDEITRRKKAK